MYKKAFAVLVMGVTLGSVLPVTAQESTNEMSASTSEYQSAAISLAEFKDQLQAQQYQVQNVKQLADFVVSEGEKENHAKSEAHIAYEEQSSSIKQAVMANYLVNNRKEQVDTYLVRDPEPLIYQKHGNQWQVQRATQGFFLNPDYAALYQAILKIEDGFVTLTESPDRYRVEVKGTEFDIVAAVGSELNLQLGNYPQADFEKTLVAEFNKQNAQMERFYLKMQSEKHQVSIEVTIRYQDFNQLTNIDFALPEEAQQAQLADTSSQAVLSSVSEAGGQSTHAAESNSQSEVVSQSDDLPASSGQAEESSQLADSASAAESSSDGSDVSTSDLTSSINSETSTYELRPISESNKEFMAKLVDANRKLKTINQQGYVTNYREGDIQTQARFNNYIEYQKDSDAIKQSYSYYSYEGKGQDPTTVESYQLDKQPLEYYTKENDGKWQKQVMTDGEYYIKPDYKAVIEALSKLDPAKLTIQEGSDFYLIEMEDVHYNVAEPFKETLGLTFTAEEAKVFNQMLLVRLNKATMYIEYLDLNIMTNEATSEKLTFDLFGFEYNTVSSELFKLPSEAEQAEEVSASADEVSR